VVVLGSRNISKLVDAAKSFSYMEQVQTAEVRRGIEDTFTMLANRVTMKLLCDRNWFLSVYLSRLLLPPAEDINAVPQPAIGSDA
jgi:hypothetical protein